MLGESHRFVPTSKAKHAAAAIVKGSMARRAEVRFPFTQLTMNWWLAMLAPRVHRVLVTLCAQSDPCTNTFQVLLPFKCFRQILALY